MASATSGSRTQSVADLIQGVSQQASQQRRDAQCEEQFDCINSVADGATARPHFEVVKVWPGRDWSNAFLTDTVHDDEKYLIGVNGGQPVAINLDDGADCTITGTPSDGYLAADASMEPKDQFRAQVIEDTTVLLNRAIAPAMDSGVVSPAAPHQGLVFIRLSPLGGDNYTIVLGVGAASYTYTQSFTTSDTSVIATTLAGLINADTATAGFTASVTGSTILIGRTDSQDFTLNTKDAQSDQAMYGFKDVISAYSKLPQRGFSGFIVKVQGERKEEADDFYVRFEGEPTTGSWQEVVAPSTETTLKAATMPHLLVNTGLNAFSYGQATWSTRIAGDTDSAKDPSFVGKKPRELFYHENRLAVLYNGGAVWSKSRFPYTFFPDTVQVTLATAPVDATLVAGSTAKGSSKMDFAVQIDEGLFLWAQRVQFRVDSGQNPFKQDTVSAKPSTFYEYAPTCDPLVLGQLLYFCADVGDWVTVRGVQFNSGRPFGDTDITAHVPKYIPSGVRQMIGSDTLRCIFVRTEGDASVLLCYNWLIQNGQYFQSAWNKWRIPGGDIIWAGIKSNMLSILQQRPEGLALLRANLTPRVVDDVAGATYATRLDLRVTEAQVSGLAYNAATNTSSFVLPYKPTGPDFFVVTRADKAGGYTRGRSFKVLSVVNYTVTVAGDLTGYQFYAGHRIDARRKESRFYVRSQDGVLPVDRLTVNAFTLEFGDTGYTRIEVASPNKDTFSYSYEGRTVGLPDSELGSPEVGTDSLTAPVEELSGNVEITIINDSFLPSYWQAASYDYTAVGKAGLK